jgi:hypothetical protein
MNLKLWRWTIELFLPIKRKLPIRQKQYYWLLGLKKSQDSFLIKKRVYLLLVFTISTFKLMGENVTPKVMSYKCQVYSSPTCKYHPHAKHLLVCKLAQAFCQQVEVFL